MFRKKRRRIYARKTVVVTAGEENRACKSRSGYALNRVAQPRRKVVSLFSKSGTFRAESL